MVELERMRNEGLIEAWGFGINRPDAAIKAATDDAPTPDIVLLACQYSIIDQEEALEHTFPALAEKGITVTVYAPLFIQSIDRHGPNVPVAVLRSHREMAQLLQMSSNF